MLDAKANMLTSSQRVMLTMLSIHVFMSMMSLVLHVSGYKPKERTNYISNLLMALDEHMMFTLIVTVRAA